MKVIFRSKDFASIEGAGLGFNNRRPLASSWQYQGRVQHRDWQGRFECAWERAGAGSVSSPTGIVWTVYGDARMFKLAVALKALGLTVNVEQDDENNGRV